MRLREYPGFLPGLALTIAIAFALCGRSATSLRIHRAHAWTLIFATGIILSATLTPSGEAINEGVLGLGSCDLGRLRLASLSEVLRFGETGLNIVLFVPLGVALALLPRSRVKGALLVAAIVSPFAIEATQLFVTRLGRRCQSADVIDNLTGLVLGLAIGWLIGLALDIRRPGRAGPAGPPTGS